MITLKHVMMANAASCISFGILFSLAPNTVAAFLSATQAAPSIFILILGLGLIANGLHIIWAALQSPIKLFWIYYFSLGDFLWVAGSILLLTLKFYINTPHGSATTITIAAMVGLFGILQMFYSRARPH